AAHRSGIVHCDFKPANVLVGRDGRVRVVDFGLAREDESASTDRIRVAGYGSSSIAQVAGTPGYAAPELFIGRPASASSDQFSFCVALWEALSGVRPFEIDALTGRPMNSSGAA
ncbi:MAG TPA: protein kinase, partial [Enhygromyxa sp.]|nr:protein kinase [Enhygromyxa sp.]